MLDQAKNQGIPCDYLRNVNVRWYRFDLSDVAQMRVTEKELSDISVRAGDLVVCEGGEPGRCAVWKDEKRSFVIQKALHRLRPRRGISSDFAAYQIAAEAGAGRLEAAFTGSTIKHFTGESLRAYEVRLAPTDEQHRIVAALEAYLSRLDAAVATLKRVQANLKRYRASVLKAAVEGRLVPTEAELAEIEGRDYEPASVLLDRILEERRQRWEASGRKGRYVEPAAPDTSGLPELPEGWCWATVEQVGEVQLGRQRSPKDHSGPFMRRYIRAANITWKGMNLDDVNEMNFSPEEQPRFRLHPGDLLLNEASGSRSEVGKPAVWEGQIEECYFQNTVLRLRTVPGLQGWLFLHSLADAITGRFADESRGVGIHHLGAEGLARHILALPPLAEQARIVPEVERLTSLLEAEEQMLRSQLLRCTRLRQSILKWAFEGKLVDQDPADEPAAALLARIKAEREKQPQGNGKRGRGRPRPTYAPPTEEPLAGPAKRLPATPAAAAAQTPPPTVRIPRARLAGQLPLFDK